MGAVWEDVRKRKDCNNITAACVQEAWQEFHAFYNSLIKKLCWWWKTCRTCLASILLIYKYLPSKQWFYTVSGPLLQKKKSANIQKWHIFLIEVLSMLTSPQVKTVKPPYKKPAFLKGHLFCIGGALKFNLFGKNWVTTFSWSGCFKGMLDYVIHPKNTKNPLCVCARCALWYYYESIRFIETMTCQRLVSVGNLN